LLETRGNTPSQGWTACGGEIQSVGPGRGGVLERAQSNRKYAGHSAQCNRKCAVHSAQCNRKYAVRSAQCAGKDKSMEAGGREAGCELYGIGADSCIRLKPGRKGTTIFQDSTSLRSAHWALCPAHFHCFLPF
jgi:hypothetical protein